MVRVVNFVRLCLNISKRSYIIDVHMKRSRPVFTNWANYQRRLYSTVDESSVSRHNSLQTLIQSWTDRLSRARVPEAQCSVNLIVAHVLGKKMIHEVDMNTEPTEATLNAIEDMVNERLKRVPVQYIIGEWDFHDMTLEMKESVLIPRPETEELASMIATQWPISRDQTERFLEIGCGTGALSLYILKQFPKVTCTAVDKNETACKLTLSNASRYSLHDRMHVIHGDIWEDQTMCKLSRDGPYDVIVSNPPYLTADEMENLEAEVADYEDHDALYGGTDGLDLVRKILTESPKLLKDEHSSLWLEVGLGQPGKIQKFLETRQELMLTYTDTLKDFTGRDRFCKLQLKTR